MPLIVAVGPCTLLGMQKRLPPNRLLELRQAAGEKLYDIAARYRVDPSTVSRWESGRTAIPDHFKLALAKHYGVGVLYLMGWDETSTPARAKAAKAAA